jgi:arsenate reductase
MAVETMKAVGIDISRQTSDGIDRFAEDSFDLAVTLCGKAYETCPAFSGARSVEHCPFDDPDLTGLSRDEIGDWAQKMVSRMTTTIPQEQTP